jgi:hypothetical protein
MSYTTNPTVPSADLSFNLTWDTGDIILYPLLPPYVSLILTPLEGTPFELTEEIFSRTQTVTFTIPANSLIPSTYSVEVMNPETTYFVTSNVPLTVTCFVEGSEILCVVNDEEEYIKVEDLKIGDLVKTYNNTPKKISYILKKQFKNDKSYSQICKLSNYPNQTKDLFLTGGHSILVDELTEDQKEKTEKVWKETRKIDDKYLLLAFIDENAEKIDDEEEYNVYHLALENEDKNGKYGIYANGILTESMSLDCYLKVTNSLVVSDYIL